VTALVFAACVVCSLSLPLSADPKTLSVDSDLETQALVALGKSSSPGQFKNMLPLIGHVVVYAGAVLPSVRAKKEKVHNSEMSEMMLVQTVADAAGLSEFEKTLPTGESIMDAMVALGNVMGGSSGYNPILMMSNVVGKNDMGNMIDEIMKFPLHFPDPDDRQLMAAEQVVLSVGLGFGDQDYAINNFIASLSETQKSMIDSLEKNVINKTIDAMVTESGDPSPALIQEIKRQMREMQQKKGSTEMMPQEFKDLVSDQAQVQALLAIHADAVDTPHFDKFVPLVGQVIVYSSAVLPSVTANKQHKKVHELSEGMLVQTLASVGNNATEVSEIEKYLPTSTDMLDAMVKVGRVMAGKNGFNPIQLMTNIVGEKEMQVAIDDVMKFPLRFPDLTDTQLIAAEGVVLSVGLGFGDQDYAINAFYNTLDEEQKKLVTGIQKDVIEKLMNAMMLPNGDPSPKLIEEIKKEMREMEKTGTANEMPAELRELVNSPSSDELVHVQALVAIHSAPRDAEFGHLLPLVRQVCVYSGVVLPSLRSKKDNKHNSELTESMLVQTVAEAAGSRPTETSDFEKSLPTSDDMLSAMVAIGNVMGGSSGFNPIQMLSNVVGKENMTRAINEVMMFPLHFPDLNDDQLVVAEEVALSAGLGFINQEQAVDKMVSALTTEQKAMLDSMQKNVFEAIVDAMIGADGNPSPALVEEIKREMREMQQKKGSTDMMPQEFKELVAESSK